MFGLYPQKGSLQPGADADIVIYDPTKQATISAGLQRHHQPGPGVRHPFRAHHGGIRRGEYPGSLLQQGGTGSRQRDLSCGPFQQAQA